MKSLTHFLLATTILFFTQCSKYGGNGSLNCEKFLTAFEAADTFRLKTQLDALSSSVGKIPEGSGQQGGSEKVIKLIQLISDSHCSISVDPQWWLIDTNPQQAELWITSRLSNKTYGFDFWLREGKIVEFLRIHE